MMDRSVRNMQRKTVNVKKKENISVSRWKRNKRKGTLFCDLLTVTEVIHVSTYKYIYSLHNHEICSIIQMLVLIFVLLTCHFQGDLKLSFPVRTTNGYEEANSALGGDEWSASCLCRFNPGTPLSNIPDGLHSQLVLDILENHVRI